MDRVAFMLRHESIGIDRRPLDARKQAFADAIYRGPTCCPGRRSGHVICVTDPNLASCKKAPRRKR
jgi:hypothetical protein